MLNVTVNLLGIKSSTVSVIPINPILLYITTYFGGSSLSHSSKVLSADVMKVMAQLSLVLHNLPFQAADHLTELLPSMFPDSNCSQFFL